ncbi:MAG: flagellar hook-associated protein 3 [Selenomonadaceae bacterium]|nr:flagellar hook-associated protein 3 [Selenomonadaceae bacterium]
MYNYQLSLNNAYQKQAKLFEQSDGSSLHRASDNPINYSKYMRYNVSETENTQYIDNIDSASSWMKNSDDVLVHVSNIMQTMKEKSVDAANSHNAEDDYAAIYKEMFGNMQEMVSSLNTQVNDRYLFAGQKDLTKPFTLSQEQYDRGLAKTLDVAQSVFFKGTTGDYNTSLYQMLELNKDGETFYLDTESGNVFTKDFVDNGYNEIAALGYENLEEAQASTDSKVTILLKEGLADTLTDFSVADYFTSQGLLKDESVTSVDGYSFTTIKQNIVTYNGDENLISMVKLNGATDPAADTVNSTGARMFGTDIFDNEASGNEASGTAMLNQLLCVTEKVNSCDTKWMSSDGVTIADVAHSTLVVEETRIGARQQMYATAHTLLTNQADNITEDLTNVSGTDIAALATKLTELTTLYNLSLSMGGRILPQSLADYL